MKREFLRGLSLTEEQIDTIMEEHGRSIERLRERAEEWKTKYEQTEKDSKAQLEQFRFDTALEKALQQAQARSVRAVRALLNMESLSLEGDHIQGLDDQLATLREEQDFLFEPDDSVPTIVMSTANGTLPAPPHRLTYAELCKQNGGNE